MMNNPILEIKGPDKELSTIELSSLLTDSQTSLRIGRESDNDIVLPNPYRKVSKYHCVLERREGEWWVIDTDSANGTFVYRKDNPAPIDVAQQENYSLMLKNGDEILILGKLIEPDDYVFWHLMFWSNLDTLEDDKQTLLNYLKQRQGSSLEYSLSQERLFQVSRLGSKEIALRPNERKLIHYISQRNMENDGAPIVCGYEELIGAVWLERYGRTNTDINNLVWHIRQKIEVDSGEPSFLKTVKGRGYLLEIKVCP
ncbi:MAG: FHA domain-containing protein [Moorea sp. SIO2I5]|nr:FHA domain-containing protein [Moorena sp. SIO2I5]